MTGDSDVDYSATARSWSEGPVAVYGRLAEAMVALCPVDLDGARALDIGAGTGVASAVVADLGSRCVAVDAAIGMLQHDRALRPPAVAALAEALPFRDAAFDAVVAACCLNHCAEPVRVLRECRRVLVPGGAVLASTFAKGDAHPVKAAVDGVLGAAGHVLPDWYRRMKTDIEPLTDLPEQLGAAADDAGLGDVDVHRVVVDTGIDDAPAMVRYRFGMAQYAPYLESLGPAERQALFDESCDVLGERPPPLRPVLLVLSARGLTTAQ